MARKIQPLFDYETGTPGTPAPPPRELGSHGKQLWNKVQREYRIDDCGGIETLAQICGAVDTIEALSDAIRAEGWTIQTKAARRAHPAIREQTQLRAFVVRSLQVLGLGVEALKPAAGRPGKGFGWQPEED
jgi:hypothetical protein